MTVLGISGLYHDSAAAVVQDGIILAAAQEERFSRIKNDYSLPVNAIQYCLKEAGITMPEADAVVYYDNPLLTLDRYMHNALTLGKDAEYLINKKIDDLIFSRLRVDRDLRNVFGVLGVEDRLYTVEHHRSHAASAFYPSPFDKAAILTVDGVGEWTTTSIGYGDGKKIDLLREVRYPDSLGLFYSAFTAYCGFRVNSGEYKFMGLAPYGEPIYEKKIRENLIDIFEDGSFRLNMDVFCFDRSSEMLENDRLSYIFGGPKRQNESRITRREMDIAASVQKITAEIIFRLGREAKRQTGAKNLAMAGGVALNCAANGVLRQSGMYEQIWIQPAAGDAGGALGCALAAYYSQETSVRNPCATDSQNGSYLGPEYSNEKIAGVLDSIGAVYHRMEENELCKIVAKEISRGNVVGWFQGRMEYGPRALGHRSILADARNVKMQSKLNQKIKYRESFRPFAPSVLEEDAKEYFEISGESPYMLFTFPVKKEQILPFNKEETMQFYGNDLLSVVNIPRSLIPAVTHVDGSARVQTVSQERNGIYYQLLKEYKKLTGCSIIVNTSFNVRGEPIVNTPDDAYSCFMNTEMDILAIGNFLLYKEEQEKVQYTEKWRDQFIAD